MMTAMASSSPDSNAAPALSRTALRAAKVVSGCVVAGMVGVLLLVAIATMPALFGFHAYTVDGNNMAPALKRGSVAIAAPTSAGKLRVGDVIAYRASGSHPPLLHRIVQITNDNGQPGFITQGDRSATPDAVPVALQGSGDKVIYTVPYAGYILDFARSMLGKIVLIGLPLPALLGLFLLPWKREAQPATASAPSETPQAITVDAQAPVLVAWPPAEAQALPRGGFSVVRPATVQPATPRASLETQAIERGLHVPKLRSIGSRLPSLEAQAIERGLLRTATPPQAKSEPADDSRAA
jgi:signal peptidase